jgi:hypothetical protein
MKKKKNKALLYLHECSSQENCHTKLLFLRISAFLMSFIQCSFLSTQAQQKKKEERKRKNTETTRKAVLNMKKIF